MKKLLLVLTLLIVPAFADAVPVTFQAVAFQDNPFAVVPLGQGLDPLLITEEGYAGHSLGFGVFFAIPGENEFSVTINVPRFEATKEFDLECDIPPFSRCEAGFSWQVPRIFKPTPGTLSVTLDGVNQTYNFRYQVPTPEPTSIALLGSGLIGLMVRKWTQ